MWKYALKRILMLVPVLLGVAFIIFSLLYITPGDPARLILGEQVSEEAIHDFREKEGLNDPFLIQFFGGPWQQRPRGTATGARVGGAGCCPALDRCTPARRR